MTDHVLHPGHPWTPWTPPTPRPDGHVNHGGPILDRHDYRDWVEWPDSPSEVPDGARVRREFVKGGPEPVRTYIHPDDVPTDPDAELVERVADKVAASDGRLADVVHRVIARDILDLVRAHDKADR